MSEIFIIKDLRDAKKLKDTYSQQYDTLTVNLYNANNQYNEETFKILDIVKDNLNSLPNLKNIQFYCLYESIPKDVFKKMCEIKKELNKDVKAEIVVEHALKTNTYFGKAYKTWSFETIFKANTEIDKVCEFIKKNNFSPMEALCYIHNYVQKVAEYNFSTIDNNEWFANDQFLAGAFLKMPEFICAGYSELMTEIIKKLNMPGLDCRFFTIKFSHRVKKYQASHARCLVKVDDDKYRINQTFFDDPTWDSVSGVENPVLAHYAMPNNCHEPKMSQLYQYYNPRIVKQEDGGKFSVYNTFNEYNWIVDFSKSKINQFMIEKIYFRVLKKMYPTESVEKLCDRVQEMVTTSYNEQQSRQYKGYFASDKMILNEDYAKKLYYHDYKYPRETKKTKPAEVEL